MKTKDVKVTVIIVTYESRNIIGNTLGALEEPHKNGYIDCVVVDNNSMDGTPDLVEKNYSWVSLIRSKRNLGYGRGCNIGFKEVHTPYVLILNPDAVIDQKALQILVEFISCNRKTGIVAPAIIEDGKFLQEAGLMTTPLSLIKSTLGINNPMSLSRTITPGGEPFQTPWVCGAVMLIRTSLFKRLRGFDPRFFLYFEETDFCRRALQVGAEIWAVGEAITWHVGGASAKKSKKILVSSCIAEHYYPSRYYYLIKHFGWFSATATETIVFIFQTLKHIKNRLLNRYASEEHHNQVKYPLYRLPAQPQKQEMQ